MTKLGHMCEMIFFFLIKGKDLMNSFFTLYPNGTVPLLSLNPASCIILP